MNKFTTLFLGINTNVKVITNVAKPPDPSSSLLVAIPPTMQISIIMENIITLPIAIPNIGLCNFPKIFHLAS